MKLLTEEIETKLLAHPYGYTENKGLDAELIVKYFNPVGNGTWLICEGTPLEDGDWELYGYCHIFEWEWGTVLLSELETIELPLGLRIERDTYAKGTIKENIY